jgi:hypothetical protein
VKTGDFTSQSMSGPGLSKIEAAYQEALDRMGEAGRFRRTLSLFGSIHRMIRHQVEQESPGLSEREIRIKVAKILYMADPGAQELLRRAEQ